MADFRHQEQALERDPDHPPTFFGAEVPPGDAYGRLYRRLRELPEVAEGDAEAAQRAREIRAEAVSHFLSETGQVGVRMIESSAGGRSEPTITRTNADGQADTNFMSHAERATLDGKIEDWTAQIDALESGGTGEDAANAETIASQISTELAQMRQRRANMMAEETYRSLPAPDRQRLASGYETYINRLDSLHSRVRSGRDVSIAESHNEETQAGYQVVEQARQQAEHQQTEVNALREHTLLYRRRFGQIPSESWQLRLSEEDSQQSTAMFNQAEESRREGEQLMEIGNNALAEGRAPDPRSLSDEDARLQSSYRRATQQFETASIMLGAAESQLTRLNQVYANALRAQPAEEEQTEGGDEQADASESSPEPDDERRQRQRQRRRRRRQRQQAQEAQQAQQETEQQRETPAGEEATDDAATRRVMTFSIGRRQLGARIASRSDIDCTPFTLEHGLIVEPLGAAAVQRYGAELESSRMGGHESWAMRLRVVRPARGYDQLRTHAIGFGGEPLSYTIANLAAETFGATAITERAGMPVQLRSSRSAGINSNEAASDGVAGSAEPLPFGSQIQAAFGRHDVSNVRAHQGSSAAAAAGTLGATAYAVGNDIAFANSPDLHTAAHEAAHVVQQRRGVQLKGGFGREGDAYEQHADSVADAVVRGQSAEPLLDAAPTGGASKGVQLRRDTLETRPNLGEVIVQTEEMFPTRSQGVTIRRLTETNFEEHLANWLDDVMDDNRAETVVARHSNARELWREIRATGSTTRVHLIAHLEWDRDEVNHPRIASVRFEIASRGGEEFNIRGQAPDRPPPPDGVLPDSQASEAADAIAEGGQDTASSPLSPLISGGASAVRAGTVFAGEAGVGAVAGEAGVIAGGITAEMIAAPVAAALASFQMMWSVFNIFNETEGERAAGMGVVDWAWTVASRVFADPSASPHQQALRYAGELTEGRREIYHDALRPARVHADTAWQRIRAMDGAVANLRQAFESADALGEHLYAQTASVRGRSGRVSAYSSDWHNRWVSNRSFFAGEERRSDDDE